MSLKISDSGFSHSLIVYAHYSAEKLSSGFALLNLILAFSPSSRRRFDYEYSTDDLLRSQLG